MNSDNDDDARDHVNPNDPEDLRYWMATLDCSAVILRDAVMIFGTDAKKIREFVIGVKYARQEHRASEMAAAAISRSQRMSKTDG